MNGPLPFSWTDLDAWARRMAHAPTPWEFHVLARLDDAQLAASKPED